ESAGRWPIDFATNAMRSLSPRPNSGLPEFGTIERSKSDKSDLDWGEGGGGGVTEFSIDLNPSPHPSPTQVGLARLARNSRRDPGTPGGRGRGSPPSQPHVRRSARRRHPIPGRG